MAGDLDGRDGDARARPDHEHRLVRLQLRARGEHPPGGEKSQRECGRLLPAERLRFREEAARVDVKELARSAIGVLADDAESLAVHVVARAAPLALPAAQRGEDDYLVPGLPAWISRRLDHARAVGGDDAWWRHALRAMGKPEVEVIEGSGPDGDGHVAGFWLRRRSLSDPDARRPYRLLVHGGLSLAQDLDRGRT